MPNLGDVPFLDGPFLELDDPTPTIARPDVLIPIAASLHVATNAEASNQINALSALRGVLANETSAIAQQSGALDLAELAVPAGNLAGEIIELEQREALSAGVDQVLVELAGVDPANVNAPPFDLQLPELATINPALFDGLVLWNGAFPLWPFVIG
jgi:hypothetical protein